MKLNKNLVKGAIASLAATALLGMGVVPAQAADPVTTTFKVHLNVPASVAADWNIWWWGVSDAGGPADGIIGTSTQTIGGVAVTKDFTPNFVGTDAYGSYAEFTLPGTLTALNNVLRTTESWDGQDAAPAVPAVDDDPATTEVDESAAAIPAKVAIPAADKPLGGDNIFPAGESWWNVGTGKREYPLTDVVDHKVHINMSLAAAQANGWNIWSWGDYNVNANDNAPLLSSYKVVTSVTKTVKGKKVTTKVTTYPYKGKVPANLHGIPFSGSDKYGAYAVIRMPKIYLTSLGFLVKRSSPTVAWEDRVKSADFKADTNNGVAAGSTDSYIQMGASYLTQTAPAFTARLTATATLSNGTITVTPTYPSAASLRGALPDSIVVTAKKGSTTKTCTIASRYNAAWADAYWGLAGTCEISGIPTPAFADGDATWDIFVQGTSTGTGKAALGPQRAAKIVVAKAPQ